MAVFLTGRVQHPREDQQLRVVASSVKNPARRWESTLNLNDEFSLEAAETDELFTPGARSTSVVVRVMSARNVVSRRTVTLEAKRLEPEFIELVVLVGDGIWVGGTIKTRNRPS